MRKFIFMLFFPLLPVFSSFSGALHPYHVSTTEIRIDTEKKSVSLSCKMFTEDLQDAMRILYKAPLDLKMKNTKTDSLITIYVKERMDIYIGEKKLEFKYLGYEIEEESTWCYFESVLPSEERSVKVKASILYDFLEPQANFIHCFYNADKKSFKLVNPDREALFSF